MTPSGPIGSESTRLARMGIRSLEMEWDEPADGSVHRLRRAVHASPFAPKTRVLTFAEDPVTGATFCYESSSVLPSPTEAQMRRGRIPFFPGKVVRRLTYDEVGPNQITAHLVNFDNALTPNPGLKRLDLWDAEPGKRRVSDVSAPACDKAAVLLFVHGTFSNCANLLNEIAATADGRQFMSDTAKDHEVLLFDHRTISVSPVLNALDLARRFAGCSKPVHVVAHSRGGLVTRWWLEAFDRANGVERKAALVGCPLEGTSLAAPKNLRNGLDMLASFEKITGELTALVPWTTVIAGIFKALSVVTSIAAATPAVDAGIAMIPGLYAMSRMGADNAELMRLNETRQFNWPKYYAIQSNFKPEAVGLKIWRLFNKDHVADVVADKLVFPEDNDLVVDTRSMLCLTTDANIEDCYNFASEPVAQKRGGSSVHHTNYFRQPKTIALIRNYLRHLISLYAVRQERVL